MPDMLDVTRWVMRTQTTLLDAAHKRLVELIAEVDSLKTELDAAHNVNCACPMLWPCARHNPDEFDDDGNWVAGNPGWGGW